MSTWSDEGSEIRRASGNVRESRRLLDVLGLPSRVATTPCINKQYIDISAAVAAVVLWHVTSAGAVHESCSFFSRIYFVNSSVYQIIETQQANLLICDN